MKIRGKIALIFGVTIVFLMSGVGYYAVKSCYDVLMDQVEDSVVSSAQLAADDVGKQLGDYMRIATATGHNSEIGADKDIELMIDPEETVVMLTAIHNAPIPEAEEEKSEE